MVLYSSNLPSISIIVPTKDKRGTLRNVLDSLTKLNYDKKKVEVIIVNGDRSGRVERIASEYRFNVVRDKATSLNTARNIGFRSATNDIIAFTDDDCVAPKDWVSKIAESFSDPSVGFVGGRVVGYASEEILSEYVEETLVPMTARFGEKIVTRQIELFKFPAGCNMSFRREALRNINLLDERITYGFDDLESLERIVNAGYKLVLNPEVLILHKHRTTLKEFLKQNFRYGRGGALFLLTKRKESRLYRWIFNFLISVGLGFLILSLPMIAAFITGLPIFVYIALGLLCLPWMVLMNLYRERFKHTLNVKKLVLYPLIDILRGLSFVFGSVHQLVLSSLFNQRIGT
jgi:cellulose synthase/poly-beta-1,6-N-acetylglucosamine synthase-like glycosyltransferase